MIRCILNSFKANLNLHIRPQSVRKFCTTRKFVNLSQIELVFFWNKIELVYSAALIVPLLSALLLIKFICGTSGTPVLILKIHHVRIATSLNFTQQQQQS